MNYQYLNGTVPMRGRIHPVEVKPPSKITTWEGWPDDVRPILRRWNSSRGGHWLSFRQTVNGSFLSESIGIYKCPCCECFCEPGPGTTAVLDSVPVCDDCLIRLARGEIEMPELRPLPPDAFRSERRPLGSTMRRR